MRPVKFKLAEGELRKPTSKSTAALLNKEPLPAVLVDRFATNVIDEGVVLSLYGIGRASFEGGLDDLVPAFTAFLTPKRAAELAVFLTQAAATFVTLSADETKPQ